MRFRFCIYLCIVKFLTHTQKQIEMSKKIDAIYQRYAHYSKTYANQIYNYNKLGMEYEDLVQEFKMKIFTAIKSYLKTWKAYRSGEKKRPVPIKYYIKLALVNKKTDFIRYIDRRKFITTDEKATYDMGRENICVYSHLDKKLFINDIDLLEGLSSQKERMMFLLYAKGFTIKKIKKIYPDQGAERVIRLHVERLRECEADLRETKNLVISCDFEE